MEHKSITEAARAILADRKKTIIEHSLAVEAQRKAHELELRKTFEEVFARVLDMLSEDEIGWSAHMNDPVYSHKGYYILFFRHGKHVKMDFSDSGDYRYEFTPEGRGRSTYGRWNMDDFIVWIAREFQMIDEG